MRATFDLFVLLVVGLFLLVVFPSLGSIFWGIPGLIGGFLVIVFVIAWDFQRWMSRHYGR